MSSNDAVWLADHPVFRTLQTYPVNPRLLSAYVEAFAPVVNSVPAFLHVTLSRSDGQAALLLREIWKDELGLCGTKSHPVLFDELYQVVVAKCGRSIDAQSLGVTAAGQMVHLCSSGPWPIGVAAMKAHECQFPVSYAGILRSMENTVGEAAEFFRVHSLADIEHTNAGTVLLQHAVAERLVTEDEVKGAFVASTRVLRDVMDGIWAASQNSQSKAGAI